MSCKELLEATEAYAQSIQPKNARRDENFISRFLTVSKNDVSKAAERYINYYQIINSIPEIESILKGHYLSTIDEIKTRNQTPPINFVGLDQNGRAILTMQSAKVNPDLPNFSSMIFLWLCTLEELLTSKSEEFKNGVVLVIDHGGLTLAHYKMLIKNRPIAKLFFRMMDGGFPILVKNVFIVNEPIIFSMVFKVMSSFLSQKMKERIKVLGKKHKIVIDELGGVEFSPNLLDGGILDLKPVEIDDFAEVLKKVLPMV